MKIVASTKLAKAQKAMGDARSYGQTSNKTFEEAETKPLEEKKTLLIISSSDKGLCGGIHSGLTRATRRMFTENSNIDLVILGEKCKAQLSRSNAQNILLSFAGVGKDVPTFADASAIADQVCLLPEEYSSVKILYNKFINATSFEPTVIDAFSEEAITQSPNITSFEVDDDALANLREYALANSLYWALAEGHACEIAARQNAMDVSITTSHHPRPITHYFLECLEERRRHDQQIYYPIQQNSTSCHYWRTCRNYYWCNSLRGYVREYGRIDERSVYIRIKNNQKPIQYLPIFARH